MDNEKKKRLEKQLKAWKASPQFKEFLEALQQYSIHFSKILSDAEIAYKEAAAFYQEWIGKKAIPQREFFEWFFQEKHDTTLAELVKHSPEVRVMDIEEAAKWFVAEYRKNKQPQQLQEPQKPAPQAFGPDLVEVVKNALAKRGLLKEGEFKGKPYQVKALYNVLVERGYLLGVEYPDKNFAAWFLECFSFRITDRSLRNPPSGGQVTEEGRLKLLIK